MKQKRNKNNRTKYSIQFNRKITMQQTCKIKENQRLEINKLRNVCRAN